MLKKVFRQLFQGNYLLIILLILGTMSWSAVMVRSGDSGFWGPNGHDGIWHISLAKSLARGSLEMPTFAGEKLKNYHLGFDLLLAAINKITTIPVVVLYFQIIPPILALLTGVLVYKFVWEWKKSKHSALWSVFFVYFGGSLGWLVTLVKEGKLGGESMFWSQQSISTLINPPFALSLILMLVGLLVLLEYFKTKNRLLLLIVSVIFGILIQIKSYAGLLSIGGLLVAGVWELIKKRKLDLLEVAGFSILVANLVFLPLNKASSGLIVFKPFWFLETMMGLTDRLGWLRFGEAMVNYKTGGVWLKAIPAYTIAFVIFILGNLGTRVIAKLLTSKWIKNLKNEVEWLEVFLVSVIGAGIVIPTFFLQEGTPWNTIQFFYYTLFFSGIFAGIAWGDFLEGKSKRNVWALSLIIVFLTIPTTVGTLANDYLTARPPAKISQEELVALRVLEKEPLGVVLTYNFDRTKAQAAIANPPRPLYLYESTAYVSAYTNKPVYMEDEVNLDITQYDWRGRRQKIEEFVTTDDSRKAKNFLKENNIKYLYLVKDLTPLPGERLKLGEGQLSLTTVFENEKAVIYKVD